MIEEKDEAREQFETWAKEQGDSCSRAFCTCRVRTMQHERYDSAFTEWEWKSWQAACAAGRLAGLEQAAKIAEHFANDELTAKEWPKYGLCERSGRFDYGAIGETGDKIAAAIREAGGVSK
jgi:hypothetical protein